MASLLWFARLRAWQRVDSDLQRDVAPCRLMGSQDQGLVPTDFSGAEPASVPCVPLQCVLAPRARRRGCVCEERIIAIKRQNAQSIASVTNLAELKQSFLLCCAALLYCVSLSDRGLSC